MRAECDEFIGYARVACSAVRQTHWLYQRGGIHWLYVYQRGLQYCPSYPLAISVWLAVMSDEIK
jgi:hypothetical protein